jgi:hypothetical protein
MNNMERRRLLLLLPALPALLRAQDIVVRGKLSVSPAGQPGLTIGGGTFVALQGDPDTQGVLKDARLAGTDFEVVGSFGEGNQFQINPIHMRALFTYKAGRRLMVTYWCDVCAIRTYTPGICWCCREETALDLLEPDKVVKE